MNTNRAGDPHKASLSGDGEQLSTMSRAMLVRAVAESEDHQQQQLRRRVRSSGQKKCIQQAAKRSKHSQKQQIHMSGMNSEDNLERIFIQRAVAPQPHSHLIESPQIAINERSDQSRGSHESVPPGQRVDTGGDEPLSLSPKSSGSGFALPISCPPPVSYHRRATPSHIRTSYRSLASNTSSTAAELDCLVSVATPPGFVRNTTSSSVRWTATDVGGRERPSNPVPMQVETTGLGEARSSGFSMSGASANSSAVASWMEAPQPGFETRKQQFHHR